jgi:hypothetical protein
VVFSKNGFHVNLVFHVLQLIDLKCDCFLMVDEFLKKVKKCLILIHTPPLSISVCSIIGFRAGSFENNLTTRREILGAHMAMENDTSKNEYKGK